MAHRRAVTQAEIARAVNGAKSAGVSVQRIEIDHDSRKITIIAEAANSQPLTTELDAWRAKRDARSA